MDMIELLGHPFIQRGLMAGVLAAVTCSLLSVFVVLRRMAFIGQGISHSAFAGIALGVLLVGDLGFADTGITAITLGVCIAIAILIGSVTRTGRISEDTAIGIFLAAAMALAVVMLSFRKEYTSDIMGYLFGNVLAVTTGDIAGMGIVACIVTGLLALLYKELYAFVFDPELAEVSGVPVGVLHYGLLVAFAATIVLTIKVVGVVLVSAFLVIPGATALQLTHRFARLLVLAAILGVGSVLAGFAVAVAFDIPSGAAMVVVQFLVFAAVYVVKRPGM